MWKLPFGTNSPGVWLTGDLTNHNPEFAILSDKQTRRESRLTLVDWTWKTVLTSFCGWNKIPSDVHSCLFHAITSKEEEMIGSHAAWTEALLRSIKEPQNSIYCFYFLQNDQIWKLRLCFIPKVICSLLGLSDVATVTKGAGLCGGSIECLVLLGNTSHYRSQMCWKAVSCCCVLWLRLVFWPPSASLVDSVITTWRFTTQTSLSSRSSPVLQRFVIH